MNRFRKGMVFVYIVGCLFSLVACGQSTPDAGNIIALQIIRTNEIKQNVFPAFARTINEPVKATQLYDAIQQLTKLEFTTCPADYGLLYNLIFTQADGTKIHATFSGSGCRTVLLNSQARFTDQPFWSLLEQIAGITANELFVQPNGWSFGALTQQGHNLLLRGNASYLGTVRVNEYI